MHAFEDTRHAGLRTFLMRGTACFLFVDAALNLSLLGPLAACVVDAGVALQQELGDGDDGVALGLQGLDDPRQSLGRVDGRVVEKDDAAGVYVFQYPLADLFRRNTLPVQAVAIPYNGNC